MKKVILAMVLILPLVFQSCKKDDDNKISLAGTKWECTTTDGYKISLEFPDDSKFVMTYYFASNGEMDGSPIPGTYTVSGSQITLILDANNQSTGTISGNKMTFPDSDDPSIQLVFTKK